MHCNVCDEYSDLAHTIFDTLCVRGRLNIVEIREMWPINRMNTGLLSFQYFSVKMLCTCMSCLMILW